MRRTWPALARRLCSYFEETQYRVLAEVAIQDPMASHPRIRSGKLHPSEEVRHATEGLGVCTAHHRRLPGGHSGERAGCKAGGSWIRNFAKVESTVACAGAITPGAIPEIKKMGFASIINLRLATEEGADIEGNIAAAKAAGIPYYHIPFSGRRRIPRSSTRS